MTDTSSAAKTTSTTAAPPSGARIAVRRHSSVGVCGSSASSTPGCRPQPRCPSGCTPPSATACSGPASAFARPSSTRRPRRSDCRSTRSMPPPARWSSSTATRWSTTTCRRWTTTTCAAAVPPATSSSTKRPRSSPATRCRCWRSTCSLRIPGSPADPAVRVNIIDTLAVASGTAGMAGGQALDLAAEGGSLTLADLESAARAQDRGPDPGQRADGRPLPTRTGGPAAAARPSACSATASAWPSRSRTTSSTSRATCEVIGKPPGSDEARGMPTYPAIAGLDSGPGPGGRTARRGQPPAGRARLAGQPSRRPLPLAADPQSLTGPERSGAASV